MEEDEYAYIYYAEVRKVGKVLNLWTYFKRKAAVFATAVGREMKPTKGKVRLNDARHVMARAFQSTTSNNKKRSKFQVK